MFLSRPTPPDAPGGWERVGRAAIVLASAAGGALADAAPTGRPAADVAWRAVGAGLVTGAALGAGPSARIAPALVAAAVFAGSESWAGAALACGVLLVSVFAPMAGRVGVLVSAAVVAGGVQLLFRLPTVEPVGATLLLGLAACTPVLWSGWRSLDERGRRIGRRVGWLAAGTLAVVVGPFLVAGALAWGEIGRGSGEANAWRVATAAGDVDAAADHLGRAAAAFGRADRRLDGWWSAPARFVPLLGQHVDAATVGVDSGQRLVASAQDIAEVADPKDLKLTDGALDLQLVRELQGPLAAGRTVLAAVDDDLDALDTRWLLPFVQDDVTQVRDQVEEARVDADLAADVLEVLPALLGADGPRRYFVVFSSPAETRELGGFMGNWGILAADGGRLELETTGRSSDLNLVSAERGVALTDPASYPARYVRADADRFWQNVTSSPDLPTVARAIADLYQQTTDDAIDGVMVVDPIALAALLRLTGPVTVPDLPTPLAAENAVEFLLRQQYVQFPERGDRVDVLADAADATFAKLTAGELPGPTAIADVLGPAVRGRHLLFWAFDEEAHPLLDRLGLAGTLPPVDQGEDVLVVTRGNMLANKLDAYLTEDLSYDVEVDAERGLVTTTLRATYTNTVPEGLPTYVTGGADAPEGMSRVLVSVYTPYLMAASTLDGAPLSLEAQLELGRNRYLAVVELPRGATAVVELTLEGSLPPGGYRLTVVRQPLATPSPLAITIHDTDGTPLSDGPKPTVIGG